MSAMTKPALADSLQKLMLTKPLDKITVSDITEDCGVNRMTFYYHFKDIYDLLEWSWVREAEKALNGQKHYDDWQQGFRHIFGLAKENKTVIMNVYHSVSREQVEIYLYKLTTDLLMGVINERQKACGIQLKEEDKRFVADFYKYAFVGLMLEWIRGGMKEQPNQIIKRLSVILQGTLEGCLERLACN